MGAYRHAEAAIAVAGPFCHLHWWILAGIGKIETDHAAAGRLTAAGNASPGILGPVLDGRPGTAAVPDTDGGRTDGDPVWDRAVGPMQFLPGTWRVYGAGGNPQNADDAAMAAGRYLCAGGTDLSDPTQLTAAILRYNHSDAYVLAVLGWAHLYQTGTTATGAGTVDVALPAPLGTRTTAPAAPTSVPAVPTAPTPATLAPHATSPARATLSRPGSTSQPPESTPPAPPSGTAGPATSPPATSPPATSPPPHPTGQHPTGIHTASIHTAGQHTDIDPAGQHPAHHSAGDQPATQHPATEHPATEHPATEHPATEHPATEYARAGDRVRARDSHR